MKDSMFDSEKNDILKDMYGEDVSLLEQEQPSTSRSFPGRNRAPSASAKTTSRKPVPARKPVSSGKPAAQPWAQPTVTRGQTAAKIQKEVKSGTAWLVLGICVFVFTVILATVVGTDGMQSVLMPNAYHDKLSAMLDQGQYARAAEFVSENQLSDYSKRDTSFAPLATQAEWQDMILETIDDWQLYVSILAGQTQADATALTWDLASNMEALCAPGERVLADVPYDDVKRGQDAVRGMLMMLGDDGSVFEALTSEDFDERMEAAEVLESTLDTLAVQANDAMSEDISDDGSDAGSVDLLEEGSV